MVNKTKDVFENIKDKLSSPFWGTFIIVWVISNWKIVFTFFNFDDDSNLNDKIEIINNYWGKGFYCNLISCVGISFGALILSYVFSGIGIFLKKIYNNIILPWIEKRTKGIYFTKEEHDKILGNAENLLEKNTKLSEDNRNLENQIYNLNKDKKDLVNQIDILDKKIEEHKIKEPKKQQNDIEEVVQKLKELDKIENFKDLVFKITDGNYVFYDEKMKDFIDLNLIETEILDYKIKLTDLGIIVFEEIKFM